jgi:hypothetical protein
MPKARSLSIVIVTAIALALLTVGFALAQGTRWPAQAAGGEEIHLVLPAGGHAKFFDFNHNGLTFGDRLAIKGPILNEDRSQVGTYFLDCWIGSAILEDGSPYVCAHVLSLRGGTITTQGLDPHGLSDVFFAVTGGTGAYEGASGQAEYVDTDTQTDIIIELDE